MNICGYEFERKSTRAYVYEGEETTIDIIYNLNGSYLIRLEQNTRCSHSISYHVAYDKAELESFVEEHAF